VSSDWNVQALVEASWECPSGVCPVVCYDGYGRECPACGALGVPVDDWEAEQTEKWHQELADEYGTALCLDEIQGRADNLAKAFDEWPKEKVVGELTAISVAAERIRPEREAARG
jgi:hypothetical protein